MDRNVLWGFTDTATLCFRKDLSIDSDTPWTYGITTSPLDFTLSIVPFGGLGLFIFHRTLYFVYCTFWVATFCQCLLDVLLLIHFILILSDQRFTPVH